MDDVSYPVQPQRTPQPRPAEQGGQSLEDVSSVIIENVSHELRTPLSVMLGYASLLHDGALGALTPEQQRAMSAIVNRADEMRSLVTRLGILMEAEAGLGDVQEVALDEIVRDVITAKEVDAERADVKVEQEIDDGIPLLIGNILQLREAISALVDNAIKFTPPSGTVTVKLHADSEWVYVEVADTGIGMHEEALKHIFTPFGKAHSSTKHYGGVGLGLSITRSVAKRHKGNVVAESQPGKGSRFTLRIPLDSPERRTDSETAPRPLRRILVVDDDPNVSFTIQSVLQKLPDCEVIAATSSDQALQYAAQQPFDLVFTDYKMPNMNGVELTKAIRALNPTTLVMWITAHGGRDVEVEARQLEVHRYLTKPLDIAGIRQTAQEALKSHR